MTHDILDPLTRVLITCHLSLQYDCRHVRNSQIQNPPGLLSGRSPRHGCHGGIRHGCVFGGGWGREREGAMEDVLRISLMLYSIPLTEYNNCVMCDIRYVLHGVFSILD